MEQILKRILAIILAIAFVYLGYLAFVYIVVDLLHIPVPGEIVRVVFIIIGIVAIGGAVVGSFDNWFDRFKAS